MAKKEVLNIEKTWEDTKRILGMPISFTKYSLSEDRLFVQSGLMNTQYSELLLYRIRDISLTRTLGQKIFGVGTITIHSADRSTPTLYIRNIKNPMEVKEMIHQKVEKIKEEKNIGVSEFLDGEI